MNYKKKHSKTFYVMALMISVISVFLPIGIDYFIKQNSPLSIYLLFLIPILFLSLFVSPKGILVGTVGVNSIHLIWGLLILPQLEEVNMVNRIYNHLGLTLFSIAFAIMLCVYRAEEYRKEKALRKSEIMLNEAQRISQLGSWEADLREGNLSWSNETYHLFGCTPSDYTPSYESFLNFIPEEEREYVHQENTRAWNGEPYEIEHRIIRADGIVRMVRQNAEVLFNSEGNAAYMIGTIQDITDKRKVERKLKESEERFRGLVQNSYDVIAIVDQNGILKYQSPSSIRVLGYHPEELVNKDGFDFNHPDDIEKSRKALNESLNNPDKPIKEEIRIRHKNGTWLHCDVVFTNLLKDSSVEGIVVNIRDITEYKKALFQIEQMAYHDATTNLFNKRGLYYYLDRDLQDAKENETMLSVFYLDLDGFKYVNDTLGHGVGDQLLINISNKLKELIKERGYVARLGGDEFVIVVKGANSDSALKVAEEILQLFKEPFSIQQNNFFVTTSIGVVTYPVGGLNTENMLKNADIAMYEAKNSGKNTFKIFDYDMVKNKTRTFQLQYDLRRAIKNDELALHYQPRINTANNKMMGVEALLRWSHPNLGYIPPMEFISVAENFGIIVELGDWVLETACQQLIEWDKEGHGNLIMSVNVSTVQFMQKDFYEKIEKVLQKYDINPSRFEIEVTETALVDQETTIQENIYKLKSLGVRIAIDDFGTGYSSLLYIRKFAADTIKIDKSFINNLNEDLHNQGIVSSIVSLAEVLKLNVVAEGVETSEQFNKVKEMNCKEVQGYFFSKPLPSSELQQLLESEKQLNHF